MQKLRNNKENRKIKEREKEKKIEKGLGGTFRPSPA
jgi:hypothetical protein